MKVCSERRIYLDNTDFDDMRGRIKGLDANLKAAVVLLGFLFCICLYLFQMQDLLEVKLLNSMWNFLIKF